MSDKKTLEYYDHNSLKYSIETFNVDMSKSYEMFTSMIPKYCHILDLGCGSGRDSKYFLTHGFEVTAVDGSKELCKVASENTGLKVRNLLFEDLDYEECFDAVWANACLLHLTEQELVSVLKKVARALRPGGLLYASFKYGSFTGYRGDRYYSDYDENSIKSVIEKVPGLDLIRSLAVDDAMGRADVTWIDVFAEKSISNI